ncbi:MAG: FHA domain-containing protein [Candidatus Faecousia sp.]|nr:FHA domain-containing protein [Candidatus Faecousia sp.]
MEIKMCTCPNGHYFNADIYARCPECGAAPVEGGQGGYGGGAFPKTTNPGESQAPAGSYGGGAFPKTTDPREASAGGYGGGAFPKTTDPREASAGGYGGGAFPKTTSPGGGIGATKPASGGPATPFSVPTQSAVDLRKGAGSEPVVGWLVCIEGPMRGVDFRLHDGYNFIGREEGDVHIYGDNAISRQKHAVVAFYSKRNSFHVGPADGRNIIELNDEPVFNHVQMNNYDVITVGNTKLMLVGLCGDRFSWTDGVKHG